MTPFLVCLATVLCLIPASVLSHSNTRACHKKCLEYYESGFRCAQQNQCIPPHENYDKEICYSLCMSAYYSCPSVCEEHNITARCQARCSGASRSCEDLCFTSEMENIGHRAARVRMGDIFGIWRKKRDSDGSSGSKSSEEMGDIFGIWRKKRDTKRSPGSTSSMDMDQLFKVSTNKRDTKRSPFSTSSMDMDDFFENWTNRRDSKRSPGSTSSEDVDDIFEMWRRDWDWSWEEGNSENDVYGDWKDKRQAEIEIQQQKQ